MRHQDENNLDELNLSETQELRQCVKELRRIVSENESAQARALSSGLTTIVPLNHPWYNWQNDMHEHNKPDTQLSSKFRFRFSTVGSRSQKQHIGVRARLKGAKTPSPKKRQLDEDSPQPLVYWKSPEKQLCTKVSAVRSLDEDLKISRVMDIDQSAFNDSALVRQNSQSPSKHSSPHEEESEKKHSLHNSGQKAPVKETSPKTQILPDSAPEDPAMGLNEPVDAKDDLNEILAEFRSLTINELEKITTIIRNSKAFLPQYSEINREGISLSGYQTKAFLGALSLATLNQIIQLLKDNITQLKLLLKKLMAVPENQLPVTEMVKQSIQRALAQDTDFLSITSTETHKLLNKTIAFLRYFQIEFKLGIETEVLHQYLGSETGCTQEYLDNNPTLVRNLIECANTKLQPNTNSLKPMAWFHQAENLKKEMLVELDKYKNDLTHAEHQAAMLKEASQPQLCL